MVGDFSKSVLVEGIHGCAVTKRASLMRVKLTSFFSSPSTLMMKLIMAEYVRILGESVVSGVGVSSADVWTESVMGIKRRHSRFTARGC